MHTFSSIVPGVTPASRASPPRSCGLHAVLDLGSRSDGRAIELPLPRWLSPGITHVEHRDEADGWFRFTMTVTHRYFGELYYQTGRFHTALETT